MIGIVRTALAVASLGALVLAKDAPNIAPLDVDPFTISPLYGDLIVNGGFESGSFSGWSTAGSFQTVTGNFGGGRLPHSGFWSAYFGNVGGLGSMKQNIPTIVGQDYILNFHYESQGGTPNELRVTVDGVEQTHHVNDPAHGFKLYTIAFKATQTFTEIAFGVRNDPSWQALDDISVVPVPIACPGFLEFDPSTGNIKADATRVYPSPPQPGTSFPVITDAGHLLFHYDSVVSSSMPRTVKMGLKAPSAHPNFDGISADCQWTKQQAATGCSAYPHHEFDFHNTAPGAIHDNLESLAAKGCMSKTPVITASGSYMEYSADVFTIWQDAYTLDNQWSQLKPINTKIRVPWTASGDASASVIVASNDVTVEYKPIEIINMGQSSQPIVQFTTVATSYYPFIAKGAATSYQTSAAGALIPAVYSATDDCTLSGYPTNISPLDKPAQKSYCDANPTVCKITCIRIHPITAPTCDLTGHRWLFNFAEYQDYPNDPLTTFTRDVSAPALVFDNSPKWNVCPTASTVDYYQFMFPSAVFGTIDDAGVSHPQTIGSTSSPVGINVPLEFAFKVGLDHVNPTTGPFLPSALKIYKATLTQVVVSRPGAGPFYLVGTSNPTVGGMGADLASVTGFSTTPTIDGAVFPMSVSDQSVWSNPKFAKVSVTFTPTVGNGAGNMLFYADHTDYPNGVPLTVSFTGLLTFFSDGTVPTRREVMFRREVTMSSDGTVIADSGNVVESTGTQTSTQANVLVPESPKGKNVGAIVGGVIGGIAGVAVFVAAGYYVHKKWYTKGQVSQMSVECSQA